MSADGGMEAELKHIHRERGKIKGGLPDLCRNRMTNEVKIEMLNYIVGPILLWESEL